MPEFVNESWSTQRADAFVNLVTGYLSGNVDHRDLVLMPEEKAEKIMICVSRADEKGLVLDL